MDTHHAILGIFLFCLTVTYLSTRFLRRPRVRTVKAWGWAGLGIILLAEVLLALRAPGVTTFFTPIVWTGYVLLVDGLVGSLRGRSRLAEAPGGFLALAFWSVPLWLVFEAYNLRLANWAYVGLPQNLGVRSLGYVWSFATIWPAIFETADFLEALDFFHEPRARLRLSASTRLTLSALGLAAVAVPVLIPVRLGQYLFGPVWVGFVLLLDPWNGRWGGTSLLADLEQGRTRRLFSTLAAGGVCGILWEFWNYWAGARWVYVFPIFQGWKIFEMPAPGFLGFPPFALECLVMYEFLRVVRQRLPGVEMRAAESRL